MNIPLTHLGKARALFLKIIDGLTLEQVNAIPKGHRNSIAWNLAHLVVTQQLLCYKLSGLPCAVPEDMIQRFQKGTVPSKALSQQNFEEIKSLFVALPFALEKDLEAGVFKDYTPYTTSVGIVLANIEEALSFNAFHEGIHLGVVLSIKKLV
jgi:hypothetical protein